MAVPGVEPLSRRCWQGPVVEVSLELVNGVKEAGVIHM